MFKTPNADETTLNININNCSSRNEHIEITDDKLSNNANTNDTTLIKNKHTKSKKTVCHNCGKRKKMKMRLILFDCRCTYKFCNECLLPEKHNCNFDYKKMGKRTLEKNNPKVEYEKIVPI
jgi:AN1-type zinc finger protein 5/6